MIANLPLWINLLFVATVALTVILFHFANGKPNKLSFWILLWSLTHSILAYVGFYQNTEVFPPRVGLVLLPATFLIGWACTPKAQTWFSKARNTKISTFLHLVRFPVEIVLFQLFVYDMVPLLMTFEGRNFDIIMGLTAPIVGIFYLKNWIGKRVLLGWNIVGLFLVLFILVNGILSAELPFQQFGFEQPNKAILYFPFILLPATIVPLVIWTHLSDIILLWKTLKAPPEILK
ncbi:MAG: hypothetical protein AB8G15_09035 [Saprospiraceae bacterium]